jgi:hypothetical protein
MQLKGLLICLVVIVLSSQICNSRLIWSSSGTVVSGQTEISPRKMAQSNNSLFVTGYNVGINETVFGSVSLPSMRYNVFTRFVVKTIKSSGQVAWIRSVSSKQEVTIDNIKADEKEDEVYVVGYFKQSIEVNSIEKAVAPTGKAYGYIMKLNKDGDITWFHTMNGTVGQMNIALTATQIIVAGYFNNQNLTVWEGQTVQQYGASSTTYSNTFLAAFDYSHNLQWVRVVEAYPGSIFGNVFEATADGGVVIHMRCIDNCDKGILPGYNSMFKFNSTGDVVGKTNKTYVSENVDAATVDGNILYVYSNNANSVTNSRRLRILDTTVVESGEFRILYNQVDPVKKTVCDGTGLCQIKTQNDKKTKLIYLSVAISDNIEFSGKSIPKNSRVIFVFEQSDSYTLTEKDFTISPVEKLWDISPSNESVYYTGDLSYQVSFGGVTVTPSISKITILANVFSKCFGLSYDDPKVCSGLGSCTGMLLLK